MTDLELINKFIKKNLSQEEELILLERIEKDTAFTNQVFKHLTGQKKVESVNASRNFVSGNFLEDNQAKRDYIYTIIQKYGGKPVSNDEYEFVNSVKNAISDQSQETKLNS